MSGLVGDKAAEGPAHEAVPVAIVFPVELVLQMGGDLLVGVHLLQRILRDRDDLLLQLLADVLDLDDGLSFVHLSRHGFKKIT